METLIEYFSRVALYPLWVVVIELFLIGLVVYWAVDFLEGTRGERLFRGVLFILVAGFLILKLVVGQYAFERLEYLYKGFLIAVLIIAVAAFQPEIRRALIRIGQPRFWVGSQQRLSRTVQEIVTAVLELSAARTGAIIVIEREVGLSEFIQTGISTDAKVTSEMLRAIFYPGAPLHDMAAVLRGDRIVAAGVQLPLAEAGTVNGVELGSRHRAAIGIGETSDAICLVVSEETGTISIAESGKLTRNVDEPELRRHLAGAMGEIMPIVERLWRFPKKRPGSPKGVGH